MSRSRTSTLTSRRFPRRNPATGGGGYRSITPASTPKCAKQFYDGRVVFGADVENAFWHFLCNARKEGVDKARQKLLALDGPDRRIPMMKVYDMLSGKAMPADVVEAAQQSKLKGDDATEARFYANLYVALYYEAEGKAGQMPGASDRGRGEVQDRALYVGCGERSFSPHEEEMTVK